MTRPTKTPSPADARRHSDVSCLALTFFYAYLEKHGVPQRRLLQGLPYPLEHFEDRSNWIDFETFGEIERRMAELFPNQPDLYVEIGRDISSTTGFGFLRVLIRSVVSPIQVYRRLPRLLNRYLFPFVRITFSRTGRHQVHGRYEFDRSYEPSDAFVDTVRGVLGGIPAMMGAGFAEVSMTRVSAQVVEYDIVLPNRWVGPVDFFRRAGTRVANTALMRLRNLGEAQTELEETNRLLFDKVEALTEAKAALDRKVHDLSMLNAVGRASTSEVLPQRLLRRVVGVISTELGDRPAAILLAEGTPPTLVLASGSGLSRDRDNALRTRLLPGDPTTERLLSSSQSRELVLCGETWLAQPMRHRDKPIGVLTVQMGDSDDFDDTVLDSLASQLAVVIDNALSYQVITDLRDNLEVRVEERTAQLERARVQLEATVVALERSDNARRDFFTNVSHEFKTPLTLILAPLDDMDLQLAQAGMPELRQGLQHIRRSAIGIHRLINEILDFAKLEAKSMPVNKMALDLARAVEEATLTLAPLAERNHIELACVIPSEAVGIYADLNLISRAIGNLVGNAIKYCNQGASVTARLVEEAQGIRVEIIDTGPGIPPDQQQRMFERFHRLRDASGQAIEGSGVGLAIVREIANLHGGEVQLDSEPGHGTTFSIVLPSSIRCEVPNLPRAETPATQSLGPGPANISLNDLMEEYESLTPEAVVDAMRTPGPASVQGRVLLVEDNLEMRRFVQRLLRRQHKVITAADGEEGLATARRELPDVIVSDVMMPRMDGFEMCRALKGDLRTRNIPVVLLSAMHDTEASVEGFTAGADDFVVKPFSPPELLARIKAQLRIRTLARAVMRMEKQTSLGLMAAGFAHEVRNPVNALVNAVPPLRKSVKLVGGGDGNERAAFNCDRLLNAVEKSGGRIRAVVDNMLTFASHGDEEMTLRDVPVCDAIDALVGVLNHRLCEGVTIQRTYAWKGSLLCYPDLINQVVMSLVLNALDAVQPTGGGEVHISTDLVDNASQSVRIRVSDNGEGIPLEDRERIFAPFYTTKPPGSGTGMGLAIARDIVALHDGTLELAPDCRNGAEFIIEIPSREPPGHGSGYRLH